jgi:integrase
MLLDNNQDMTIDIASTKKTLISKEEISKAEAYIDSAYSENTKIAYKKQWNKFSRWCELRDVCPVPCHESAVATYIASMGGECSMSTIRVAMAAISTAHRMMGFNTPCHSAPVRTVLKGIGRQHGSAQKQKAALSIDELRSISGSEGECDIGKRNRAICLVGFFGALRRSEIVNLKWSDIVFKKGGMEITISKSKTDKMGVGQIVAVPASESEDICPVSAMKTHEASNRTGDYVFTRMDRGKGVIPKKLDSAYVAKILKTASKKCGLDFESISGHSVRSGFATSAIEAGKRPDKVKDHLRHSTYRMTEKYIRKVDRWKDNPADGLT